MTEIPTATTYTLDELYTVLLKVTTNGKKGRHLFLLTRSQRKRLERAKLIYKSTVKIKLSKKQVKANVEHRGAFLGALLGLASRFLPTILSGLATGLISGSVEKAVSGRGVGDGLYLYKSGRGEKIIPIRGGGVQLMPKKKLHGV